MWQGVEFDGRVWNFLQGVAKCGRVWQGVEYYDRVWLGVAGCGIFFARCG